MDIQTSNWDLSRILEELKKPQVSLKLMKYIDDNGRLNFKLGLIKNSRGIKEATSKFEVNEVYS